MSEHRNYEAILYREEGPVGIITLNRPHDGNMFNATMCRAATEEAAAVAVSAGKARAPRSKSSAAAARKDVAKRAQSKRSSPAAPVASQAKAATRRR